MWENRQTKIPKWGDNFRSQTSLNFDSLSDKTWILKQFFRQHFKSKSCQCSPWFFCVKLYANTFSYGQWGIDVHPKSSIIPNSNNCFWTSKTTKNWFLAGNWSFPNSKIKRLGISKKWYQRTFENRMSQVQFLYRLGSRATQFQHRYERSSKFPLKYCPSVEHSSIPWRFIQKDARYSRPRSAQTRF